MKSCAESTRSLRILVVDDVAINRVLAIAFLGRLGHQVEEVDRGLAAIARLAQQPPIDLLLLDINMPELSGEDVCAQLRANPALAHLKIIAYTAHAGSQDQQRYLSNGFDAVLVKPISLPRLKDAIAGVL
ncbi:MAG: response regulator [Rhodoferax sp.]|nr:response regulator [Rhodoferax sp.]